MRRDPTEGKDYAICPMCGMAMSVNATLCRDCWRREGSPTVDKMQRIVAGLQGK